MQTCDGLVLNAQYGNGKNASTDRTPFTQKVLNGIRQKFSTLTFRYSTGLVTLNLSMVVMMMAGVVRKKRRRKRTMLMMKQRIHQEIPPSDRCSLQEQTRNTLAEGDVCLVFGGVLGGWSLWTHQRTFCGSGAYETLQL